MRADRAFGQNVAVSDSEAALRRELVNPDPADTRDAELVNRVLQHQTVVKNQRSEHHDASLVDEPAIALDHLAVVLAGEPTGVRDDELHGTAGPDALVEGVLDGEDR